MSETKESHQKLEKEAPADISISRSQGTWTEVEENAVVRKLDIHLMPLLIAGFFVLQLDRSNISNALTDTITDDLNITPDQVNFGSQLMLIGIVIAEIPSNLILQKIGASIWLTFQMLVWGTIALTQSWCTNIHSFYATRFLLGLFEGGYIPGAQYMLALFYTRKELARRTAIFYFGNYSATATGSLIAAGWLFMLEGIVTLLVFFLFLAFLPRTPTHTAPIHGRCDFFNEHERYILPRRVIADDETKANAKALMSLHNLLEAATDYWLWLHMILNIVSLAPKGALQLYGPTVIKSLGCSKFNANLLNAMSSVLVIIFSYIISLGSDRTNLRGPWCILAFVYSIAFAGALFGLPTGADKWARYAVFTLLGAGNALAQGLNDAWVNINATTARKRSLGLALVVIGSNLGGIAGQHLFRSTDGPRYTRAFLAILLLYAASIPITLLVMWIYWRGNRKARVQSGPGAAKVFQL
ncbi:major facilitator superfamily domain-containing protein [Aspergillus pseudoustus]|uniref:Major facilitator superfamily domain-containing protein n=1 Tax=Aspergillus pseudoustus TaxID=1810923 RepID=A0ABR4KI70_9EURO